MNLPYITTALGQNKAVFENLLSGIDEQTYLWKPSANKWCLLEIVCHLYDEEREDFRARVKHVLGTRKSHSLPLIP